MPAFVLPWGLSAAAQLLGRIKPKHFELIQELIAHEAEAHPERPGWQKLEKVAERLKEHIGARNGHTLRTLVQIAYTVMKLKGVL